MITPVYKIKSLLLVFVCMAIVLSACSNDSNQVKESDSSEKVPRVVTNEEAQLLSRVLYENHLAKNASFVARSGDLSTEGFVAQGKVDWEKSLVESQVSLSDPSIIDLTAISSQEEVFENYLGLDVAINWVRRDFDAQRFGVDALSLFVIKLAAVAADNPLLIKQDGAQYLGIETVSSVDTKILKSPGGITFFITEDGELKKVKAPIKGFANEVSFLFSAFTETEIEIPEDEQVVNIDEISAFYFADRPNF